MLLWNLDAALNHELDDHLEVSLTHRYLVWIHIICLKSSKKELARSYVITVRAKHYDGHVKLLKHLLCFLGTVISGTVPCYNRFLPPISILLVELCYQMLHEQGYHVLVAIALRQAEVDVSLAAHRRQHCNTRLHALNLYGIVRFVRPPMPPPKISHPEPRLVYVEDGLVYEVLGQVRHSPTLPHHQALLSVALRRNMLYSFILEAHSVQ